MKSAQLGCVDASPSDASLFWRFWTCHFKLRIDFTVHISVLFLNIYYICIIYTNWTPHTEPHLWIPQVLWIQLARAKLMQFKRLFVNLLCRPELTHREIFSKSYQIKLKSDCIYHFPIDLELNGRPFAFKSIGKW